MLEQLQSLQTALAWSLGKLGFDYWWLTLLVAYGVGAFANHAMYVLIHELMHLKQADHSRRFWRHVEAACPGFRDAERWLRKNGSSLF